MLLKEKDVKVRRFIKGRWEERDMVEGSYKCDWCGFEFSQVVGKGGEFGHERSSLAGKRGVVSTQVKCPHCSNFISTWK